MRFFKARRVTAPLPLVACLVIGLLPASASCVGGHGLVRRDTAGLAWFAPAAAAERQVLDRWAAGVGPPVLLRAAEAGERSAADAIVVVAWNTALGAGDVGALLTDVRAEFGDAPVVLMLQEAYRGGPEVPVAMPAAMEVAGRLGTTGPRSRRQEIEAIADTHDLHAYYVPSMRNGGPRVSDEDRGNAILSSYTLHDPAALELPFERQRRVAIAATIAGRGSHGNSWRLRFASVHLDNMVGLRRLWIMGAEFARARQARALVDFLHSEEVAVIGGDLNTWFGFADLAYAELAREFPDTDARDRRPTFRGVLRLDHLFFRLPKGWTATFRRGARAYGSDHYPLIGRIVMR